MREETVSRRLPVVSDRQRDPTAPFVVNPEWHHNYACALVARTGRRPYESCKHCSLTLGHCLQFRAHLTTGAAVILILAAALYPLPTGARLAIALFAVAALVHHMVSVGRASHEAILTAYRLRHERARAQEIAGQLVEANRALERSLKQLRETQDQLLRAGKMAAVGTLAAGVAHEINNPLAYLIGNLRFIREELATVERVYPEVAKRDLCGAIKDAQEGAERVSVIVRDLKTISRSDEETRGPIDVRRVLDASLNIAWNEIRHRAKLVKDYGEVPEVDANEARLGQVFLNLLVNAAQAISGSPDENGILVRTCMDARGRVAVEVHDTGCGIPPEVVPRLFEPFFTTKPVGVGTGLGLSICHGIVTNLDGEITVESQHGRGSVFRVLLPPSKAAAEEEEPAAVIETGERRARILVVDDEAMVGASIQRLLAREHEVVATTSARQALARLQAGERFDVILCDLMMPEMNGMELHDELRRAGADQAERMVFLTGGAFTANAREFLDHVPNQRLEKPFDAGALRGKLQELLR